MTPVERSRLQGFTWGTIVAIIIFVLGLSVNVGEYKRSVIANTQTISANSSIVRSNEKDIAAIKADIQNIKESNERIEATLSRVIENKSDK